MQVGGTLHGLSVPTGKPLWTTTGPQPRTAAGSPLAMSARLLSLSASGEPPAAVFQWADQAAVCRTPRRVAETKLPADPSIVTSSHVLVSPSTIAAPDPRYLRKIWWAQDRNRSREIKYAAWGLSLAILLVLFPGWTVYKMIARRRWSLKTLLLVPLLVGLIVCILRIPSPMGGDPSLFFSITDRLATAVSFVPPIVFLYLLTRHVRQSRWRRLLGWGVVVLFSAACMIAVTLQLESRRLAPGERFVVSDWDVPLVVGFFVTSWFATAVAALIALGGRVVRIWRASPATKVALESDGA